MIETAKGIYLHKAAAMPEHVVLAEFEGQPIYEIEGWATTEDIDREGEVLKADSWRSKSLQNVKLLLCHEWYELPIGKPYWVRKKTQDGRSGLYFKARMGPQWQGLTVGEMYLNGDMDSFSVGFNWFQREIIEGGDGVKKPYRIYTDLELYEISAVTIPANPNATLASAIRALKTIEDHDEFKSMLKDINKFRDAEDSGGYKKKDGEVDLEREIIVLRDTITGLEGRLSALETPPVGDVIDASKFDGDDADKDIVLAENEIDLDTVDLSDENEIDLELVEV